MRRLTLSKETLAELGTADLVRVNAAALPTIPVAACVVLDPSDKLAACDSLLRPCISYTCTR